MTSSPPSPLPLPLQSPSPSSPPIKHSGNHNSPSPSQPSPLQPSQLSQSPSQPSPSSVTMDHVLSALNETVSERETRIRSLFSYFDSTNAGYIDSKEIERGLSALQIPADYKYAKELLRVCDCDKDGRVEYYEFKRYMDDKELELYRIFQDIDVQHNGAILPEELYDALLKAECRIVAYENPNTEDMEIKPNKLSLKNFYDALVKANINKYVKEWLEVGWKKAEKNGL
ncbi:calcium-binding mitochondrial carrier protein SCaMC-1-like protein, partial [Tanacetum coccineum]